MLHHNCGNTQTLHEIGLHIPGYSLHHRKSQTSVAIIAKMKFIWRIGVILAVLSGPVAWYFLSEPLLLWSRNTNNFKEINEGLRIPSLWDIGSLHNVKAIDRASFRKLYSDDRHFFGDGKESRGILTKDTKPYRNQHLDREGDVLDDRNVRILLEEQVLKSSSMRNVDNIRKLLIAADLIQSNRNLTTRDLKAVLNVNKMIAKSSRVIKDYGAKFELDTTEREVLITAAHGRLEENRKNVYKRKSLGSLPIPAAYKIQMKKVSAWYKFYSQISTHHMYEEGKVLEQILSDLQNVPASYFNYRENDTRLHAKLTLKGRYPADFIPIRFSRTQETRVNQHHTDDWQRHVAEIAAFHLDRALGFRRAAPASGRMFNIFKELKPVYRGTYRRHQFVVSLEGNDCIVGQCEIHCSSNEIICGTPREIESAVLLRISIINMTSWDYPWRASTLVNETTTWLTDYKYCSRIRNGTHYNRGRRMLDMIDLAIFDFLQGNLARTTYYTFTAFGNDSFIIHNNNERGFGKAFHDETSILAPLYQCCVIRYTTLHTLLDYVLGPVRLSEVMWSSLARDPLQPVLLKQHLLALDRRLKIILKVVSECIKKKGAKDVVIADGL